VNPRPVLATPAVLGSGRVLVDAVVDGDGAAAGELRGRSRSVTSASPVGAVKTIVPSGNC
jgi:hypothetical protein